MVQKVATMQFQLQFRSPLAIALIVLLPGSVMAYTPDSPAVRAMLDRAVSFLQSTPVSGPQSGKLGGRGLVGLAIYKYHLRYSGRMRELPTYTAEVLGRIGQTARSPGALSALDNYSLGISLIFLMEVSPRESAGEIVLMVDELARRQLPNGPWTYTSTERGDTSQTQYAVLGAWAAKNAGVDVPRALMDGVANWLIRTQTPEGGWAYHATDPGSYVRIKQGQVRPSTVAAGLGSLYIAADFLGMPRKEHRGYLPDGSWPSALVPVAQGGRRGRFLEDSAVDLDLLKQAMDDGNTWMQQNFTVYPPIWPFYHLYSLERYYTFRETLEGKPVTRPRWYDLGIRMLMELQEPSGAFVYPKAMSATSAEPPVGTAFGVLFAVRSTQATIAKVIGREGTLRGGYGLPNDVSDARLKGGQIVGPAITGEVEDMVEMLEDGESEKIENLLENPESLMLESVSGDERDVVDRLIQLARSGSYKTRIIAVRTLGRQGNLDHVPILIYALTDPDPRVMREARDGLRMTSRKFGGFGLSDRPSDDELEAAVEQWKSWYRSIRPNAVFFE
jgi:hypothetical protein